MQNSYTNLMVDSELSPSDEYFRILFLKIVKKIGEKGKSILITSALKGEGKTTTIIQLAKVAARDFEKKILLLEGDAKNPQLSSIADLSDKQREGHAILNTAIPGLDLMTLDKIIKNRKINGPVFVNGLKKIIEMFWDSYDYILVDCPPVLPLVDTEIIAGIVDGILLVVKAEGPAKRLVKKALETLPKEKVLGVVFNGVQSKWQKYGHQTYY